MDQQRYLFTGMTERVYHCASPRMIIELASQIPGLRQIRDQSRDLLILNILHHLTAQLGDE